MNTPGPYPDQKILSLKKEDIEKMTREQLETLLQLALDGQNQAIVTIQQLVQAVRQKEDRIKSLEAKVLAAGGKP